MALATRTGMKLINTIAATAVVGAAVISAHPAQADSFVPCSFNYQVIACKFESLEPGRFRITWRDGKSMIYQGAMINSNKLRDTLGGNWKYIDFALGKSFSLSNPGNGNVIIWNGTYREYGKYVGL